MSWLLTYGTQSKTLEEWGITNLRLQFVSQGVDRMTFDAPVATIEQDALFDFDNTVKLYSPDGIKRFEGVVIQTPATANGQAETHGFVVAGPWWHFEENVLQQIWLSDGVTQFYSAHLMLNGSGGLSSIDIQTTIETICTYLLGLFSTAPFQVGTIEGSAYPPVTEATAISCAAAVRNQLRWVPDAQTWFDYSTAPPTLNIKQRSSLTASEVSITGRDRVDISPRYDIQRPAVAIRYEITTTINGKNFLSVSNDIAPSGATGREPRALNLVFNIQGPIRTVTIADLTTEEILAEDPDTAIQLNWWKLRHEKLQDPRFQNIIISDVTREGADQDEDGNQLPSEGYSYELIEGQIAPWMNFDWQQEVISCKLTYDFYLEDPTTNPSAIKLEKPIEEEISVRLVATNATTGTYRSVSTDDTGDPLPTGMAQFLYDQLAELGYDGNVQLVDEEPDFAVSMGNVLNLTGGRSEWSTMRALIQQITVDVDRGVTSIQVGPPQHLGPSDLMELLKVNRRFRFTPLETQTTGETGDSGEVKLGQATANRDTKEGGRQDQLKVIYDGTTRITLDSISKVLSIIESGVTKVSIDLSDIPVAVPAASLPVKLREYAVCVKIAGVDTQKTALFLASNYY